MDGTVVVGLTDLGDWHSKEITFDSPAIRKKGRRVVFSAEAAFNMLMLWDWVGDGNNRKLTLHSEGETYTVNLYDDGGHKQFTEKNFANAIDKALAWCNTRN